MVQINLFTKQKQTHRCRNETYLKRKRRKGINQEFGTDINNYYTQNRQLIRIYCRAHGTLFNTV